MFQYWCFPYSDGKDFKRKKRENPPTDPLLALWLTSCAEVVSEMMSNELRWKAIIKKCKRKKYFQDAHTVLKIALYTNMAISFSLSLAFSLSLSLSLCLSHTHTHTHTHTVHTHTQMHIYANNLSCTSIHSASLFPHFVKLQPYSKMDSIFFFLHTIPCNDNVKKVFWDFLKFTKNKKLRNHTFISIHSLCHEAQNWAEVHPVSTDHPWDVSTA